MTVVQQTKRAGTFGLYGALAVAGVASTVFIFREMVPTRMSSNRMFHNALDYARQDVTVESYLGSPLKGYGKPRGANEGRRNFVDHEAWKDEDGVDHSRIVFALEGPKGKGLCWAERRSDDAGNNFSYVIFQPQTPAAIREAQRRSRRRGAAPPGIAIVDNRKEPTMDERQLKCAHALAKFGAVLYGADDEKYTTMQKAALGDAFSKIDYVQCDAKKGDDGKTAVKRCMDQKGLNAYPMWYIAGQLLPGYQSLSTLEGYVKKLRKHQRQQAGR